jgi:hypothetical protein
MFVMTKSFAKCKTHKQYGVRIAPKRSPWQKSDLATFVYRRRTTKRWYVNKGIHFELSIGEPLFGSGYPAAEDETAKNSAAFSTGSRRDARYSPIPGDPCRAPPLSWNRDAVGARSQLLSKKVGAAAFASLPLTHPFERTRYVATFAHSPECAAMHVVLSVTPIAVRCQRDLGDVLGSVAGMAIEIAVCPGQRIACLRVVIEAPSRPTIRVVAERTICP